MYFLYFTVIKAALGVFACSHAKRDAHKGTNLIGYIQRLCFQVRV